MSFLTQKPSCFATSGAMRPEGHGISMGWSLRDVAMNYGTHPEEEAGS